MKNSNKLFLYKSIRVFSLAMGVFGVFIYIGLDFLAIHEIQTHPDWPSVPLYLKIIRIPYACLATILAPMTILGYFVFQCKSPKSNLWGLGFFIVYSNPIRLYFAVIYLTPHPATLIILICEMLFVTYVISIWNHRKYEEKFQEKLQGLKLAIS